MKNKFFLLWVFIVFAFTVTSCKNDTVKPEQVMKTLADTLIGNWELVKITGYGQSYEVTEPLIIKIFSQNTDLSFNYECWRSDTLAVKDKITLVDTITLIRGDGDIISCRIISMGGPFGAYPDRIYLYYIYKEENHLFMNLTHYPFTDADLFHFKKTSGKR